MSHPETTPKSEQVARALLSSLSLILIIIGQLILYTLPGGLGAGLLLSGLAVVMLIWIGSRRPPMWVTALVMRLGMTYPALLIGVAVCLSIVTAVFDTVFEQLDRANYFLVMMLWAGSAIALLAAFAPSWPPPWRAWLKDHRNELMTIGLVTLAAAAIRFYQLGQIPRVINGDEGLIGQFALTTDRNPLANPFSLFENFGGLYLQAIGLAVRIFGRTPAALRLMPAIGGALAIPALYLLAHRLFGRRVALLAAILLAVSHLHIHFSRTVAVAYIQETILIPLELYFFISALEQRSARRAAIGGLILGLHFSVYVSAQVIAALLIVYLLIAAVLCRPLIRGAGRQILVFWFSVAVIALPQSVYAARHPDQFLARLNADGTFQSGWLANMVASTGQSPVQILAERVAHVFLSLNYYPADEFYGARIPALDVLTSVLFLFGLGYALWRTRDYRYLLLNGYFWAITVAIGIFSVPPGADSYRLLAALPAAILLAAIGLEQALTVLGLTDSARQTARVGALALMLGAISLINLQNYYVDFAQQCRYGGPGTRFASYLGAYLGTLNRETTVYLLSTEELHYGTHLSVDFLSGELPVANVPGSIADLRPGPDTVVIATPARVGELRAWMLDHPRGTLHSEYDCGQLILLAYQLP